MAINKILSFDPIRSLSERNNHPKALLSGQNRCPDFMLQNKRFAIEVDFPTVDNYAKSKGINFWRHNGAVPSGGKRFQTVNAGWWGGGNFADKSAAHIASLAGMFTSMDIVVLDIESEINYSNPNTFRNIAVLGHAIRQLKPNIELCHLYRYNADFEATNPNGDKFNNTMFLTELSGSNAGFPKPDLHVAAFAQNLSFTSGFGNMKWPEAGNKSLDEIWTLWGPGIGYANPFFKNPEGQNLATDNDSTAVIVLGLLSGFKLFKKLKPNDTLIGFQWYHVEENTFVDNYRCYTRLGAVKKNDKMLYSPRVYEAGSFWCFWETTGLINWDALGRMNPNPDNMLYHAQPNSPTGDSSIQYLGNQGGYNHAAYQLGGGWHYNLQGHVYDAVFRAAHIYSQVQNIADSTNSTNPPFEYRRESCNANGVLSWGSWTAYTPPTNGAAAAQAMLDRVPFVSQKTNNNGTAVAMQDFWANMPHRTEVRMNIRGNSETMQSRSNEIAVYRK